MLLALLAASQQSPRFLPPAPLLIQSGPINVSGGYAAPAVADLNGDGLEDLVVGFYKGGGFQVFLNIGSADKHVYRTSQLLKIDDKSAQVDTGCCIGSVPVFADLDGDGMTDLVAGTYQQGIVWFRGKGGGKFAPLETLIDKSFGAALSPAVADWDGDGDMDIIVGTQWGQLFLFSYIRPSEGSVLMFDDKCPLPLAHPVFIDAEGAEIKAEHGGPTVYDIDSDGIQDLLIGDAHGGLTLYQGKKKGGHDMKPGKSVLPAFPRDPRPGINLKPFVTDWNNDGKPDILVGDFRPDASPVTLVPANVQEELERLTASSSASAFQIFTRSQQLEDAAMKEAGITDFSTATPEQRARYDAAVWRLTSTDKTLNDLKANKNATDQRIDQLRTQKPIEGTVWILYGL